MATSAKNWKKSWPSRLGASRKGRRIAKPIQQPKVDFDSIGVKKWYAKGKLHREDGPAVEYPDGTCYWYQHGRKHRLNGPAVEFVSGQKEWYIEGELQRLEMPDGSNYWYRNGRRHRENGPAIDCAQRKVWYLDGIPQAGTAVRH